MNYKLIICSALVFCACSKSIDNTADVPADDNSMKFSVNHPTRATNTSFEAGDVMGVYATEYNGEDAQPLQVSGNIGNNAAYAFGGDEWSSEKPIYWGENKVDVYAYYPRMEVTSISDNPFAVKLDQSTPETATELSGYEASDFMWAKAVGVEKQTTAELNFKHRLSKVVLHLVKGEEYEGDLPEKGEVYVHNVVAEATADIASGFVTKYTYGAKETIKARQVSSDLYEAIIVPQRVDSNLPLFELVVEGVSYLVQSKFVFKMGVEHNIYLTLDSDPGKIKIEVGGEVEGGW